MSGFIAIPRSLQDDENFQLLNLKGQFIFKRLIELVMIKKTPFDDHGLIFTLQPGQFCTTYRQLATLCHDEISKNDIERNLLKLEKLGFLRLEVRQKKTIITITHKETYETLLNINETRNETNLRQSRDIKEQDNNINKEVREAHARDEKKEREEKSIDKKVISFKSKSAQSPVVSILYDDLCLRLYREGYTKDEIDKAIQAAQLKDSRMYSGGIPGYLSKMIDSERQGLNNIKLPKKEKTNERKVDFKNDPNRIVGRDGDKIIYAWEIEEERKEIMQRIQSAKSVS